MAWNSKHKRGNGNKKSSVGTKGLLHSYCNPVNNVCAHNSQADSILVTSWAEMTDWQVVEGHQSRAPCSPGAQVMVRPHPQVLSLLQGQSRDKPSGVPRLPISMEMKRARGPSRLSLAPLWSAPSSLRGVHPRLHSHRTRAAGPQPHSHPTTPPTATPHPIRSSLPFFF